MKGTRPNFFSILSGCLKAALNIASDAYSAPSYVDAQ
jgi:hypothetical protein